MANLLGQNIGTNYKGILNLNTLNGNLTTTLEAITDGDGNASTLLLSTTLARVSSNLTIGGSTTASARLHVRAAAASIASRFEDNAGVRILEIGNGGYNIIIGNNNDRLTGSSNSGYFEFNTNANGFDFIKQNAYAGSGTVGAIRTFYSINNHAGTVNGIFLNATETSLTGTTHNLIDLQVGGVSRFRVDAVANNIQTSYNITAAVFLGNAISVSSTGGVKVGSSRIRSDADGNLTLLNDAANSFGLLKFGGTTNAFPAIKRNGAAIDFRLADDSAYCSIFASSVRTAVVQSFSGANNGRTSLQTWNNMILNLEDGGACIESGVFASPNASAILQANSTTKGFLPPRMTTAQRDLIGTPAAGLMIYNTSTNRPNFYDGSAWVAL